MKGMILQVDGLAKKQIVSGGGKSMNRESGFLKKVGKQKILIAMALPACILLFLFNYLPMYGALIAFKNYRIGSGILAGKWVGFKHFIDFFKNPYAWRLIKNTFILAIYSIIWSFPAPIILALLLNELKNPRYKKAVQTITYLPHFISSVIIVGMLKNFASENGLFNQLIAAMGGEKINFFMETSWFRTMFIGSALWQSIGWNSIVYLAALSNVDVQLYEAATIDGANRFHKLIYVTLPAIVPTVMVLLILQMGSVLNQDYQKVLLMYNSQTYEVADIITTYSYREGIEGARYSYSAAIGLLTSAVSAVLLITTNKISDKLTGESMW